MDLLEPRAGPLESTGTGTGTGDGVSTVKSMSSAPALVSGSSSLSGGLLINNTHMYAHMN